MDEGRTQVAFLYAEMVPSWIPTFRVLVGKYGAAVDSVHWDHRRKTPYVCPEIPGVRFFERSRFDHKTLGVWLDELNPDVIFVSGWMDRGYLRAIRGRARNGTPVLAGLDDWWKGSMRQRAAGLLPEAVKRSFFSHAWVAGPRQYEYAKRIGFRDDEIVFNLLSCDQGFYENEGNARSYDVDGGFLYVGRFSPEKGTRLLAEAFGIYRQRLGGHLALTCVGNGPERVHLEGQEGITLCPFAGQEELGRAYRRCGVFVMPSIRDFSPLVVHEAASAGMPLVISSNVGNGPTFLINNHNGFLFESGNAASLAEKMLAMEQLAPERVKQMGENSRILSRRVTPDICAASLLSVL